MREYRLSSIILGLESILEASGKNLHPLMHEHLRKRYDFQLERLRDYGMHRLAEAYEKAYTRMST